jgi:CRISPR type III-B/RAMP module-associated protein Cmr3
MKYLSGNLEVFSARSLEEFFIKEIKYGHAISRDSQTVEKGHLYTSTHIRFKDELEFKNYDETGFIIAVDGIEEKDLQDNIIYLGGERREAVITLNDMGIGKLIPEQPEVVQKIQVSKRFCNYSPFLS